MNSKKIGNKLFKTMLVMIPLAGFVWLYGFSVHALAEKIYQDTAKPFLANGVIATPHKATTTKPLQIEYMVLKVPTAGKTAAKK